MRSFEYAFFGALLLAWIVAYFVWFRPWLKTYKLTAGVYAALANREMALWTWIGLHLQGMKSAILMGVTSLTMGGWGLIEALFGIDPSSLAPFQDSALWRGILHDEMAMKAASMTCFAAAFLTLYGKVRDVKIMPKPGA